MILVILCITTPKKVLELAVYAIYLQTNFWYHNTGNQMREPRGLPPDLQNQLFCDQIKQNIAIFKE